MTAGRRLCIVVLNPGLCVTRRRDRRASVLNVSQIAIAPEPGDIDALPDHLRSPALLTAKLEPNRNVDTLVTNGASPQLLVLNMGHDPLNADPARQAIARVVYYRAITGQVARSRAS